MVPAYVLTGLLFVSSLIPPGHRASGTDSVKASRWALAGALSGLLWWVPAIALPALLPVFELPEPTGSFAVGATSFHFVDVSREEAITSDPADKRELLVRVWYPADPPAGARTRPYWEEAHTFGSALAGSIGMPAFLFDHLALVDTHSYGDAPLAADEPSYPVLVFSHGYYPGFASQNTVQMEELASHGYVVFSIAHSYETLVTVYPNGDIVHYSEERGVAVDEEGRRTAAVMEQYEEATDDVVRQDLWRRYLEASDLLQESISIWTDDTLFVMDELEKLNSRNVRFAGRLDLSRLGIWGMSFGGATAGQVCLVDSRCRAGINLDGLQYGNLYDGGVVTQPFMIMYSDPNEGMNDFMVDRATNTTYRITVAGTMHFNFTDFSLFSRLFHYAGFLGSIDGQRMTNITSTYTLAFFDKHLKGKGAPLLEGETADYPEVSLVVRNP